MFSVILYSLFKTRQFTNVNKETKTKVREHITNINPEYRNQYGVYWKAQKNLYWIGLKRVKK